MRLKKAISIFLVLAFILTVAAAFVSYGSVAETSGKINGANIVYYWNGDWKNVNPVLSRLKFDGFNYIAVCIIWYQDNKWSTEIKPDKNMSPSDERVRKLIIEAHKKGIGVMVRPYVNIKNGNSWEGQINFGSNEDLWNKWFDSYEKFVLHYATIAEDENAELFSVGAELEGTVSHIKHWEKIIESVRKVYNGKILYAANSGNEKNVKFYDKLDYISLDFYPTLSEKKNPSEKDFENTLRNKYIPELKSLYDKYKKPIIISEVGYRSIDSAYVDPWDYDKKGKTDYKMQAELYEAFFNTVYKEDFIKGVFLWYAPPSLEEYEENFDKFYKDDYAFFNKPAESVIKKFFTASETANHVNSLLSVNSAAVCYSVDEKYIKNLAAHLDLIVLQTRFLDPKFVSFLSKKMLVAGYVSVIEFDGAKSDIKNTVCQMRLSARTITGILWLWI